MTIKVGDEAKLDSLPRETRACSAAARTRGTPHSVHYSGNADDPNARTGLAALAPIHIATSLSWLHPVRRTRPSVGGVTHCELSASVSR